MVKKFALRLKRHRRVRAKVRGTSERPRLCVYRSTKHIYAQLIDDDAGVTVAAASSLSEPLKGQSGGNITGAKSVGTLIASQAQDKGIKAVVFDRGGFRYHGRVKSLAEAARAGGLEF